ncbi:MAG: hypothetical protein M1838_000907 [Thelocarpon superellum]|nr:MAG: hypothetical protein M1838_000907 [Thelocarpon superellum]
MQLLQRPLSRLSFHSSPWAFHQFQPDPAASPDADVFLFLPEGQAPETLNLNLSSNNPFRNRAASPSSLTSQTSPQSATFEGRPVSRNPFVDVLDADKPVPPPGSKPPRQAMAFATGNTAVSRTDAPEAPTNALANLDLSGKQSTIENVPPPSKSRAPPTLGSNPLPARNGEKSAGLKAGRSTHDLNIFADPTESVRPRERRPRRNSDTSVVDARSSKVLDPDDERRRRERRHRDSKYRDGKSREKGARGSPRAKKPNQRLDVIDKLDVTSIYGTGLFHHDGPFDACNPHRNRKESSRAPMRAFPKDSANNVLGGSGPVNKDIDHNLFHGTRGAEAFSDFSTSGGEAMGGYSYAERPIRPMSSRSSTFSPLGRQDNIPGAFNPIARVDPVHGDESLGLGTSTFLEGAPASRNAIKRRESESETVPTLSGAGGLSRKKSLVQKIRGMNSSRQFGRPSGRVASPEQRYELTNTTSPREAERPFSSGNIIGQSYTNNTPAPAYNEYDKAYDQKGESIAVAEREHVRFDAPSNPRRELQRRTTHDGLEAPPAPAPEEAKPMGFLSRVKSLKGGRRARPAERT